MSALVFFQNGDENQKRCGGDFLKSRRKQKIAGYQVTVCGKITVYPVVHTYQPIGVKLA